MMIISEYLNVTAGNLVAMQKEVAVRSPTAAAAICRSNLDLPLGSRSPLCSCCCMLPFVHYHTVEISFGNFLLPVLLAPAVGTLYSNLCPNPPFLLLCSASVFAIMKILNSLLPKRAWVEREYVWEPLLLETKQFSSPTLRMRVFPQSSFLGLQCFLPSLLVQSWGSPSGLSCSEVEPFSLLRIGKTCFWFLEL